MMSVMDSSSLRDGGLNMQRMPNMMGRDMSFERDVNMLGMDQQRNSNMMGRNIVDQDSVDQHMMDQVSMGRNMIGHDNMGRNMMGRNVYNIMSNRGMTSDMSNKI